MLPAKLAFVDLETTGARSEYDRILEIGIIRVEDNVITKTFNTLLNPLSHIPPEIERLTGISSQDIIDAPVFSQIKDDVYELLQDCVFVAHNVRFDYAFLKNEFLREDKVYTAKHFCTVRLSQMLYPMYRRHNLDSIIERHGFTCVNRHRALDDARVIFEFYQKVQKELPLEKVTEAVNKALKKPSLPLHLKKQDLDELPEEPGVYIFYGDNLLPLYIGKSKNIKDRVLSHFASDIHSGIEMKISQQIKDIKTMTTAGELGALFLESKLIKEMLPLYNRRLRLKRLLTALRVTRNKDGFDTVSIDVVSDIPPSDLQGFSEGSNNGIIGFFRSAKQAKDYLSEIAKEYGLCEKMLGLEKAVSGCFGYRLERCKGACVGKEKPLFYNIRFLEAIHGIKVKPWPFAGPIVITEKNETAKKEEYFLIDKWCYLGSSETMRNEEGELLERQLSFDLDLYKILRQYLRDPKNLKHIRELPRTTKVSAKSPLLGVTI